MYCPDYENGDDIESIDYRSLIHIITELHRRIEKLEAWQERAQSSAKSVREHIDL
jgi:transcription elongation GreA/GreB family factor